MRFKDAPKMGEAAFRRFLRLPRFDELLALHEADRRGSRMDLETFELVRRRRAALTVADIRPRPLLSGRELMALGYAEGPALGTILKALEEEQLEGRLHTREEALEWIKARFPVEGQAAD
jgi:poly(A) polymerase